MSTDDNDMLLVREEVGEDADLAVFGLGKSFHCVVRAIEYKDGNE